MEIEFKRDTAFRKQFFVPDSFAHPAKMDAQLLIWIVERYTKPGEVILDPMAGMGTTMLACGLGRNVVLVELEGKFCKMCRDNWEQVKMNPQLGYAMGNCQIIQGDARNLEGLLADKIITSPPFGDSEHNYKHGLKVLGKNFKGRKAWETKGEVDKIITSPPFGEAHDTKDLGVGDNDRADLRAYSYLKTETEGQIGNLPYGQIDEIITSPPFGEALSGGGIAKYGHFSDPELAKRAYSAENMNIQKQIKRVEEGKAKMKRPDVFTSEGNKAAKGFFEGNYSYNPQNIGNLPYGQIDKIVTSPPYEGSLEAGSRHTKGGIPERDKKLGQTGTYADLGVDKIITSPPYEGVCNESKNTTSNLKREERLKTAGHNPKDFFGGIARNAQLEDGMRYSQTKENIGNLKSTSYLEAMLQVYSQCHKVLKPDGLVILVLKNFIRNKQVIRLDLDTIKLCEQAGFKLAERHYRKLSSQSFWRIIYYQKHPEVELIDKEDILVFQK